MRIFCRLLLLVTLIFGLSLAPLITGPAFAGGRNNRASVMTITEVATGTPVTESNANIDHATGYLLIKTENKTGAASLVVTVFNSSPLGDFLICTVGAITTETTTIILIGHYAGNGEGITQVCDYPMSERVKFTFTTSGVDADFDVTADMEWVDPGA